MRMTPRVEISRPILDWALERSGRTTEEALKRFPKLEDWREGTKSPTLRQLEGFARFTYTPVGSFFRAKPPEERLPLPDFRTRRHEWIDRPSPNLLDTIYLCEARQDWYRRYALQSGAQPVEIVGSLGTQTAAPVAAGLIRSALDFDLTQRADFVTWSEALREMIDRAEDVGVLVMVSGVVANNTHRGLDPNEFGGFALIDEVAPLIFINGADTKAAQIFTLAHELAHVWLGQSAVSSSGITATEAEVDEKAELWCNKVAAELLVPEKSLEDLYSPETELHNELQRLARLYKVSTLVVLRRVFDLGFLKWDAYQAAYDEEIARAQAGAKRSSGGDFYNTQPVRASKRFTRALLQDTLAGRTLYGQAFRLLGIRNPKTFQELGERMGVA